MVRTTSHGVPNNTAKESDECKNSVSEHGRVYDSWRGGGYRGAEECKDYVASPQQKGNKVSVNVDFDTVRELSDKPDIQCKK
jgi:hypothetical protein